MHRMGGAVHLDRMVCAQCGVEYRGDHLVGEIVAGRYHVVRQLGEGGMGQVFLAEQVKMRRLCALKVMRPALATDPRAARRFGAEAENASRISHPNVATIYDVGETKEGLAYLAMEFVDGETLSTILHRERRLAPARAVALARQVAEGLGAAHESGIVHRDLKPDNVMIVRGKDGSERVKVVDFGIAKSMADERSQLTRTGHVVGTPAYMSPEQLCGQKLDGRTDLYSLGCILFEMLTGCVTFAGPSGEVDLHRRLTEPAPRARLVYPDIPRGLDALLTKVLAPDPDERYQTAAELCAALAECVAPDAPAVRSAVSARWSAAARHRRRRHHLHLS